MPDHRPEVGYALLNRRGSVSSGGWACKANGEPFKFTELQTLQEHGGLWVVSTPQQQFLIDPDVSKGAWKFLLHGDFLPTQVDAIAFETGPHDGKAANKSVRRVADVLGRVAREGQQLGDVWGALLSSQEPSRSYVSALRSVVAQPVSNTACPKDLEEGLSAILSQTMPPLGQGLATDLAVRIPVNRISQLNRAMMGTAPGGAWREQDGSGVPNLVSWAIGHKVPSVALVVIKGAMSKHGASSPALKGATRGGRRWMAMPEMVAMSGIVEMRAERLFVAEESISPLASLKVPPPDFAPAAYASVSAGLLAEAYLHAVSTAIPSRDGVEASSRSAFIISRARTMMIQEALALSDAGFTVVGMGPGHVTVSLQRSEIKRLRKFIMKRPMLLCPAGLKSMEPPTQSLREVHGVSLEEGEQ